MISNIKLHCNNITHIVIKDIVAFKSTIIEMNASHIKGRWRKPPWPNHYLLSLLL